MSKINQFSDNNEPLTKSFNPVGEVVSEASSPDDLQDISDQDSEPEKSIYWINQANIKSGEKLHDVSLSKKQIIFIQSIISIFDVSNPVEAMETFFEEGVVEHENLTQYSREEVKCFWQLLQEFRKFQ